MTLWLAAVEAFSASFQFVRIMCASGIFRPGRRNGVDVCHSTKAISLSVGLVLCLKSKPIEA